MKKVLILAVGLLVLSGCASVKRDIGKVYEPTEVSFSGNPIVKVGPDSRGATIEAYILAEGVINTKGVFTDINILELKPEQSISISKAKKYLSKWRFKPAMKDGKRVNVKHQQKWFFKI